MKWKWINNKCDKLTAVEPSRFICVEPDNILSCLGKTPWMRGGSHQGTVTPNKITFTKNSSINVKSHSNKIKTEVCSLRKYTTVEPNSFSHINVCIWTRAIYWQIEKFENLPKYLSRGFRKHNRSLACWLQCHLGAWTNI